MGKIERIKAFLNLGGQRLEIGDMVQNQNKVYFKYNTEFLSRGLEISPFKMKLTPEIISPKEMHFEGLFGVFSDSVPDGWGRLLLDRKLLSLGVSLDAIGPLDRLSLIDGNSTGAISYEPQNENKEVFSTNLDLDQISEQIEMVITGDSKGIIDHLFTLGGSSGGARPKIFVGFNPETEELLYGKTDLPEGFDHWIIKFPSSNDLPDIALIEFAYNQMAQNAGIEVNEFRLFESNSGKYFFGSKRFDRIGNRKLHLHSVAGLLHDNFRMSTLDYGHIMDCAYTLEKDFNAHTKILRLAAFNVLAHNRDDHSKNFSFLMDENGKWKFAPAYDLTYSNSSFGFHSTSIAGESRNPGLDDLQKLASHFGVRNTQLIFDPVKESIVGFDKMAVDLGISKDSIRLIKSGLK